MTPPEQRPQPLKYARPRRKRRTSTVELWVGIVLWIILAMGLAWVLFWGFLNWDNPDVL